MNKYAAMVRPRTSREPVVRPRREFKEDQRQNSLSHLSYRENKRASQKSDQLLLLGTQREALTSQEIIRRGPSETDFSKLLHTYESIISCNRTRKSKAYLTEHVPSEIFIEIGETHQCRIHVKDRLTPLKVSIKRQKGKVKSFYSKTKEPSEFDNEGVYFQDIFYISEGFSRFRSEKIYLAMYAFEDSKFSINVKFVNEYKKKPVVRKEKEKLLDSTHRTKTRCKSLTNFVKINMKILPVQVKAKEFGQKVKEWNKRRNDATKRRSDFMVAKRERTLNIINKQKQGHEQKRQERIERENKNFLRGIQMIWVKFIYMHKMGELLEYHRTFNKNIIAEDKKNQESAKKIQYFYRKNREFDSQMILSKAVNLLTLYRNTGIHFFYKQHTTNFNQFVKSASRSYILTKNIDILTNKIINIQNIWRIRMKKSKDEMGALIAYWNTVLGQMLEQANKIKNKHKKRTTVNKIMMISSDDRNEVLEEHLLQKKKEHRHKIRVLLDSRSHKRTVYASKLFSTQKRKEKLVYDSVPSFEFLPSEIDMIAMISLLTNRDS